MESTTSRWFRGCIVALLLSAAGGAKADPFGLVLNPNPPTATLDGWKYEYTLQLSVDERFTSGDFFTIFDFQGYRANSIGVIGSIQSDWLVSVQDFGPNLPLLPGAGNPEIAATNLVFTYNGDAPLTNATINGGFFACSSYGPDVADGQYSADHERSVIGPNQTLLWKPAGSTGMLFVPTPEPTSLMLLSTLGPLGWYVALRRRQAKNSR